MTLDNPLVLILVILLLLLLVVAGFLTSISIIFAYVPFLRDWLKEQVARLRERR